MLQHVPTLPTHLSAYGHSPLRLPFKIELRDYALWVAGRDPFASDDSTELPAGTPRSIESYVAAQVHSLSGGANFSVNDLQEVVATAATLFVFDGLDEVADIDLRRVVVDQVTEGSHRLAEVGVDVQVLITSRPSAYANSPGFAEDEFVYIELLDLSAQLMLRYAESWSAAKNLNHDDKPAEIGILTKKLNAPHMPDLALN